VESNFCKKSHPNAEEHFTFHSALDGHKYFVPMLSSEDVDYLENAEIKKDCHI